MAHQGEQDDPGEEEPQGGRGVDRHRVDHDLAGDDRRPHDEHRAREEEVAGDGDVVESANAAIAPDPVG
ncbi:MAG TPA: hypothetical protein VGR22_03605 [Thermomicrobiales bacterium]|nr:hypothetical protein [Thermomicrobiales bacterium]